MSKGAVENLFEALYSLVEVRKIFRETSPTHNLSDDQEVNLGRLLGKVRKNLEVIEEEMLE